MSTEKNTKVDEELVFGPHRSSEGDKAIARMMFGKNAERMHRDLALLFALWGIDFHQEDDEL